LTLRILGAVCRPDCHASSFALDKPLDHRLQGASAGGPRLTPRTLDRRARRRHGRGRRSAGDGASFARSLSGTVVHGLFMDNPEGN
jgi:hypothetical protein